MTKKVDETSDEQVRSAIKNFCKTQFGVLDSNFLCQSVSVLNPKKPITVTADTTLSQVIKRLQECKIGGVLVVNTGGRLIGIFTERDCVQKVLGHGIDLETTSVEKFMTRDPIAQPADITTAYALNLMSHGGFRHLPLVDQDQMPIGVISVKDVLDYIVGKLFDDLLTFEVSEATEI